MRNANPLSSVRFRPAPPAFLSKLRFGKKMLSRRSPLRGRRRTSRLLSESQVARYAHNSAFGSVPTRASSIFVGAPLRLKKKRLSGTSLRVAQAGRPAESEISLQRLPMATKAYAEPTRILFLQVGLGILVSFAPRVIGIILCVSAWGEIQPQPTAAAHGAAP